MLLRPRPGLRLWAPLWQYGTPDVVCFSSSVKPSRLSQTASCLTDLNDPVEHLKTMQTADKQLKVIV